MIFKGFAAQKHKFLCLSCKSNTRTTLCFNTKNRLASHYFTKKLCKLENPAEVWVFTVGSKAVSTFDNFSFFFSFLSVFVKKFFNV